jgi:hypothetical protein
MNSSNKVTRLRPNDEPLFFERVPVNQRRAIAVREVDECLGGALQLVNLADQRRAEFNLALSDFKIDEAREMLLKLMVELERIKL